MKSRDELGSRMKEYYEKIFKTKLVRRMPVIIRIDGKAFHTFTKDFKKPFDKILMETMQETTKFLCENIQGCVLGYTQSDEISLLLIDYKHLNSSSWFDNEVQKMCSISASMATLTFNKIFDKNVNKWMNEYNEVWNISDEDKKYEEVLLKAVGKGATFDSRCFNIPREEVTNYFYWRQLDATRNSIEMVGHANFSYNQLHKKSCNAIQDMLHEQKGINWNDFSIPEKRGSCCIKETYYVDPEGISFTIYDYEAAEFDPTLVSEYGDFTKWTKRSRWIIDRQIPNFVNDDRNYIDRFVNLDIEEER